MSKRAEEDRDGRGVASMRCARCGFEMWEEPPEPLRRPDGALAIPAPVCGECIEAWCDEGYDEVYRQNYLDDLDAAEETGRG